MLPWVGAVIVSPQNNDHELGSVKSTTHRLPICKITRSPLLSWKKNNKRRLARHQNALRCEVQLHVFAAVGRAAGGLAGRGGPFPLRGPRPREPRRGALGALRAGGLRGARGPGVPGLGCHGGAAGGGGARREPARTGENRRRGLGNAQRRISLR